MVVRKFRVGGTLEDELVIMFMADYHIQIDAAKSEFEKDVEAGDASSKAKKVDSAMFGRVDTAWTECLAAEDHPAHICTL